VACALIVISLALQGLATSRLLCAPSSIDWLAPLRVVCAPALWPFTDYPMFSEPHRRGDPLAWVEAVLDLPGRTRMSLGRFEVRLVRMEPGAEDWPTSFEREERRLRAQLQPVLASHPRSAVLAFERHRLVLTERGFVPPGAGEREGEQ
jgi:hypothetical protein